MGKGRKYIQMDDSLLGFMPLCRLSVQLLRIYMHNLELFVFPGPRQLHFPIILRKQRQISLGWASILAARKELLFSLPPFSLVVKEGVALLRKLAVVWHGLQGGEDLLEHWPFLKDNSRRPAISNQHGAACKSARRRHSSPFHSLSAPSSSRSSRARQSWRDSHSEWWVSETNTLVRACRLGRSAEVLLNNTLNLFNRVARQGNAAIKGQKVFPTIYYHIQTKY